jgi:UDPglucose 6-dehydrogenase
MRLSVIGCGHLGATHAAGMAEIGHEVIGLDIDADRVAVLQGGKAWFHEPDLDPLISKHVATGRLRFTTDWAEVAAGADVHFLATETPGGVGGAYDLTRLRAAVELLAPQLTSAAMIVGKSTVPVGTSPMLADLARTLAPAGAGVEVAWNPEFLREGHAVVDTLRPDRIVAGTSSAYAEKLLRELYAPITDTGIPMIVTDTATAELVKGSANLFLASRVSLINAIGEVCELAGADVTALAAAIGLDERIGRRYLSPGLGYGGGCLPKDTRAFGSRAGELGSADAVAYCDAVDTINRHARERAVSMVARAVGGNLIGKRVAVWGCSFKSQTDDIRDSPGLAVARKLHAAGAQVVASDPMARSLAQAEASELTYVDDPAMAVHDAEVVFIGTAWPEYRAVDPSELRPAAKILVDARNAVSVDLWQSAGWAVHRLGVGR